MPWKAGRDLRHLSQAAHSFLERTRVSLLPVFLLAKPFQSIRGPLWPPAVVFKFNYSHAPIPENITVSGEVGTPHVEGGSLESVLRWDRLKDGTDESQLVPLAPPPEVLSIFEVLFSRHPRGCTKFDLRQFHSSVDLTTFLRHPRAAGIVLYFLEAKDPDRAFWVLALAVEVGFTFPRKLWPRLLEKFAELGKWESILRLINVAVRTLGFSTTALLNWRLQALTETQRYIPLEDALSMFEEGRVKPSKLTYHLLISMHLRNSDLAGAITCIKAMESAGFPVTVRTCAVVLLSYRSLGFAPHVKAQAVAALDAADDDRVSNDILNGLVQLLLDAEDMPGVVDVLTSASRPAGGPPTDNGVDITRADDGSTGTVGSVTDSPPSRSAPPRRLIDVTTYNILLHHLARLGDLPRAMYVLQQMSGAQVFPDSATAAALVRLYFAAGHPNDAYHVIAGVLVDYPTAIALLPQLGFVEAVLPEHPIPPPTPPTIHIFNAFLRGTLRVHGLNGLRTVLSMMRIVKVDVSATALTILLSFALRRQCPRRREMIRIVRRLMSSGVVPTLQHLHALMDSLLRDERAIAFPRGWNPPPPAVSSADAPTSTKASRFKRSTTSESIKQSSVGMAEPFLPAAGFTSPHYRKHGNLLRPIFQSLTARRVRADRATFAMRIKHDALVKRDTKAAIQTLRIMVKRGLRPNRYHYGALMEGYAAEGSLHAAADVMRTADEAGIKADVKTHTILIAGYARLKQPAKAVEAFRRMVSEGIRPDVPAIDALVSAFFRVRAYKAARRVLLQLWHQAGSFPEELAQASLRELAVAFRALHPTNPKVPEKLSSWEQRKLRRETREMLQTWTGVRGKHKTRTRYDGDVLTRKHEPDSTPGS